MKGEDWNLIDAWREAPAWYRADIYRYLVILGASAFLVLALSGCALFTTETTIIEVKRFPCPVKPVQAECSQFQDIGVREFCYQELVQEWNDRWGHCARKNRETVAE